MGISFRYSRAGAERSRSRAARSLRLTTLLFAFLLLGSAVRSFATEPIVVEYARGRNKAAMQLWQDAEAQLEKGEVAAAHRSVDASIRSDPTLYPALYTRAKVEMKENKLLPALQDCSNALHQDPTFVEAALLRAEINSRLGRYAESIKEVDHVVAIRPRLDGLARALSQRAWFRLT